MKLSFESTSQVNEKTVVRDVFPLTIEVDLKGVSLKR